jgi:hypothetical protein
LIFPFYAVCQVNEIQHFLVPPESKEAPDYKMKVNGREVFVYNSDFNPFAIFNFAGTVDIEVITRNDLKWADIRPLSDSIPWRLDKNSLHFRLSKPANLSIEFNGESTRALFIFTGGITSPYTSGGNLIMYQGGKAYVAGLIELKSNDVLYIEGGALVKGYVQANHARNIKILGNGILDGSLSDKIPPNRMINLFDCSNVEIRDITIHNSPTWTIVSSNCDSLSIKNIKQVNWKFGSDGIDLVGTSHVRIEDSFMKNNDDCIVIKSFDPENRNPDRSLNLGRNVTDIHVNNCTFWNMSWGNALEIGFELRCDSVSGIEFRDIDIIHVERGAAISIHNGDFSRVTDILYENINIEDSNHKLIDLAIFLSQYSIDRPESGEERNARYMNGAWDGVLRVHPGEENTYEPNRGFIDHIVFRNITVVEGPFPFSIISGYDSKHIIDDIIIENMTIFNQKIADPASGHFYIENAGSVIFK